MFTPKSTRRTWILVAVVLVLALIMTQLTVAAAGKDRGRSNRPASQPSGPPPQDPSPENVDLYLVSTETNGSVDNGCDGTLNFKKGDVIAYEPADPCWFSWFSAANSGLTNQHNIAAIHDDCEGDDPGCDIYISFGQNPPSVPDVGNVKGNDIVKAVYIGDLESEDDYGDYSLFFDGSDVGLTTTSEKIDSLYIFDDDQKQDYDECNHLLLISTVGAYNVPDGFGGNIKGAGEDVLIFCGTNVGSATAGFWDLYHDGSDRGTPKNEVYNVVFEENSDEEIDFGDFEFTTKSAVTLPEIGPVGHSEVIKFYSPAYEGPYFSFPDDADLDELVDALHIYYCTDSDDPCAP